MNELYTLGKNIGDLLNVQYNFNMVLAQTTNIVLYEGQNIIFIPYSFDGKFISIQQLLRYYFEL